MKNPFVKQRGFRIKNGAAKATYEGVSRYLRVLGVELPTSTAINGHIGKPVDQHLRCITQIGDEQGLFICVNLDAAEVWFDEWCRHHPFAGDEQLRGASWAAYLVNTVDIDRRPRGARTGFFKLEEANLIALPQHRIARGRARRRL